MSIWYKVAWIPPLFDAFNRVYPARTKASDGTIGNLAHAEGVSGHNPDDTPGVKAERQDTDTIPEVRAADVTSDLRDSGADTMWDVVLAILNGPRSELDRLIYIICDGWIWRKANSWQPERYTGDDQHYGHAHFSGDPASDEDGRPWTAVLTMKDENMSGSFGPTQLEATGTTSLTIPPVNGGAADPRMTWLNIGADCGGASPVLRIWQSKGDGGWQPLPGHGDDGRVSLSNGVVFSQQLDNGVRLLSVTRMDDWAGSVSVCFERK